MAVGIRFGNKIPPGPGGLGEMNDLEFQTRALAREKQLALAQAMRREGLNFGGTEMIGQHAVQKSPFEIFGKLAQGFIGSQDEKFLNQQASSDSRARQEGLSSALKQYMDLRDGQPGGDPLAGPTQDGKPLTTLPVAADPRRAALSAALSGYKELQGIGVSDIAAQAKAAAAGQVTLKDKFDKLFPAASGESQQRMSAALAMGQDPTAFFVPKADLMQADPSKPLLNKNDVGATGAPTNPHFQVPSQPPAMPPAGSVPSMPGTAIATPVSPPGSPVTGGLASQNLNVESLPGTPPRPGAPQPPGLPPAPPVQQPASPRPGMVGSGAPGTVPPRPGLPGEIPFDRPQPETVVIKGDVYERNPYDGTLKKLDNAPKVSLSNIGNNYAPEGEKAMAKKLGELSATDLFDMKKAAESGVMILQELPGLKARIQSDAGVIAGAGASIEERAVAWARKAGMNVNVPKLINSQGIDNAVANIMAGYMKSLGARGLTDKDMEVLKDSMVSRNMEPEAMLQALDDIGYRNQRFVDQYQARLPELQKRYPDHFTPLNTIEVPGKVPLRPTTPPMENPKPKNPNAPAPMQWGTISG